MNEAFQRVKMPRPVTPLDLLIAKLSELETSVADLTLFDAELGGELHRKICDAHELATGLERYVVSCTSPASDDLNALDERTGSEDWAQRFGDSVTDVELEQEMLSGHVEGQFLQMLVRATNAKRVLEIGMFTGYSALAMAEGLPDDGKLIALELDRYAAEFAKASFDRSRHGEKIDVRVGPAIESLRVLSDERQSFDFVFIDADKPGYTDYLRALLANEDNHCLLEENALVCVDNTLMQGQPFLDKTGTNNGVAIADFNEFVNSNEHLHRVMVPLRDGITLIQRRASRTSNVGDVRGR